MKCPSCNAEVEDDASICPNCDAVLDASFLDAPASSAPKPRRPAVRPARRPASKPAGAAVKRRPAQPRAPSYGDNTPPPSAREDWRAQLTEADWKETAGREPEKFEPDRALDANDALVETGRYFRNLTLADKLALGGALTLLTSTFLPWAETASDGDVLGVRSSGIVATLLSGGTVAAILVRTRKMMPQLNALVPWVVQLGTVGVAGLWCLIHLKLAWNPTLVPAPVGNYQMWVSKPGLGLLLALLAGITAVVGTIFGLKDVGRP